MGRARSRKSRLIQAVAVIPLVALLGTATMANADGGDQNQIHACANPSGLTRLVGASEKCHPSEKSYHWPATGSEGGAATVIDSLGKTVGPLVRHDAVALTIGGNRFLIGVGTDGFRNSITGLSLYYESASCAGVALIQPSTNVLLPLLLVAGTTGYYGGSESQVYPLAYRSSYNSDRRVFEGCFPTFPGPLAPARTLTLPEFKPPFSIK